MRVVAALGDAGSHRVGVGVEPKAGKRHAGSARDVGERAPLVLLQRSGLDDDRISRGERRCRLVPQRLIDADRDIGRVGCGGQRDFRGDAEQQAISGSRRSARLAD
jgi:hypothetical protein